MNVEGNWRRSGRNRRRKEVTNLKTKRLIELFMVVRGVEVWPHQPLQHLLWYTLTLAQLSALHLPSRTQSSYSLITSTASQAWASVLRPLSFETSSVAPTLVPTSSSISRGTIRSSDPSFSRLPSTSLYDSCWRLLLWRDGTLCHQRVDLLFGLGRRRDKSNQLLRWSCLVNPLQKGQSYIIKVKTWSFKGIIFLLVFTNEKSKLEY